MDKVIPTIYCTTITTYRNTKTNEVFKEKVEGPDIVTDVTVQVSPKGLDILGPANCYRERLRGKYRMHIMLKSDKTHDTNGEKLHSFLQDHLKVGLLNKLPSSVKVLIDVNPVSVL